MRNNKIAAFLGCEVALIEEAHLFVGDVLLWYLDLSSGHRHHLIPGMGNTDICSLCLNSLGR